jgi:ABC-type multidrug transport system ATPase subunit
MMLALKIDNIWKSFAGQPVLRGCSYSFESSGVYVLTGPNGSGKSTLLRICSLLESADEGAVTYLSAGRTQENSIELKRRITLVLPKIGVLNDSVFRNVAYGLKIRGLESKLIKEKVSTVLEFTGLDHKKKQNALTLSSGETQRVGIARALVIEPEILFLDEPTASVDVENTCMIERIVREVRSKGMAVIMTTHDPLQARRLADQMIAIKDGKLHKSYPQI